MSNQKYVFRVAEVAWEKSLYGDEESSLYYFGKALEFASSADEYLSIAIFMQKSDLPDNKALAYGIFIKALETSKDPARFFRHLVHRRDLTALISEYVVKMPDDLFHFLIAHAKEQEQLKFLCGFFRPFANFITDPDPETLLGDAA